MAKAEQKEVQENKSNVIQLGEKWAYRLDKNTSGNIAKTINNFYIILENDERFKDKILYNEMSNQIEVFGKDGNKRSIQDVDTDRMQKIIEKDYKIYDSKKFESALRDIADNNSYNPIKEYLESLKWDGVKRIDTAFADYFNAEPTEYNAMCMRLILFGAIERIYNPGAQFDYMFIIKGAQGLGKSTFFKKLCGNPKYYQEDLSDISGDKSFDRTRGKWMVEMSELTAMKKTELEKLKTYITTRTETYRLPYAKFSKDYPRRFILIGTTNEKRFLFDSTGERRFPIVEVTFDMDRKKLKKDLFKKEESENIKQILAEAFYEYRNGKKFLEIPYKFKKEMELLQSRSKEEDYRVGIIENYLENKDFCCPFEIWCEAFGHSMKEKYTRTDSKKIIDVLEKLEGWRLYSGNSTHRKRISVIVNTNYGTERHDYGSQVCYERYPSLEEIRLREKEQQNEETRRKNFTTNLNNLTGQNLQYKDYIKEIE